MVVQELHTETRALRWARRLARVAHHGKRHGTREYTCHLEEVREVLLRFGLRDEDFQVAAILHDVLEDRWRDAGRVLERWFGTRVLYLVEGVSDEPRLFPEEKRAEVKARTYPKTRAHEDRVALKLADRIANVEAAIATGAPIIKMYRKEQPAFEAALRREGEWEDMWKHLDELFAR